MRNDPGRFCPAGMNQIAQVPVVMLDVGLPGANRLPFEPEEYHVKSDFTLSPGMSLNWPLLAPNLRAFNSGY